MFTLIRSVIGVGFYPVLAQGLRKVPGMCRKGECCPQHGELALECDLSRSQSQLMAETSPGHPQLLLQFTQTFRSSCRDVSGPRHGGRGESAVRPNPRVLCDLLQTSCSTLTPCYFCSLHHHPNEQGDSNSFVQCLCISLWHSWRAL